MSDLHESNVPEIIRRLKPSYVLVHDDVATVEIGGGFGRYGVVAFAQGNDTTNRIPGWGQKKRKLIEEIKHQQRLARYCQPWWVAKP